MKLKEVVEKLNLAVYAGAGNLDNEVSGGYVSDLLSDVLANSKQGDIWVTLQAHPNIVAIAAMKGLSGIVIVNRKPEEETIEKADSENLPVMASKMSAFELAGRLYALGIMGTKK